MKFSKIVPEVAAQFGIPTDAILSEGRIREIAEQLGVHASTIAVQYEEIPNDEAPDEEC